MDAGQEVLRRAIGVQQAACALSSARFRVAAAKSSPTRNTTLGRSTLLTESFSPRNSHTKSSSLDGWKPLKTP
jgi:hypothetical protein